MNDHGNSFTPPNFAPADFTQWPTVTPFALARADEFNQEPPPALTSDEPTRVFNEVKSPGEIDSKTRTSDQTVIGNVWNGDIQDFWNEIAQTAALGHHLNLPQSARLFALLNISLADTTIAFSKLSTPISSGDLSLLFKQQAPMVIPTRTPMKIGFR